MSTRGFRAQYEAAHSRLVTSDSFGAQSEAPRIECLREGFTERERWHRCQSVTEAMASEPVGAGAMATEASRNESDVATEASRNGRGDGDGGQSDWERWQRRPVGTGWAMATEANRDGSDGIGASRNGKGDGDGGQSRRERWHRCQSEREGRWQRWPIEAGRAMATVANRSGKGDGNVGQLRREGRWQRRPIETGRAMET